MLISSDIAIQTGTEKITLLNDLEATAWGILNLSADHFIELNSKNIKAQQDNIAVLAAGTGLGEAIIVWNGQKYQVISTEGGHTDFAPTNEEEILLLRYLMACYSEHVSYERLLSGEGLVNIYQFLKTLNTSSINNKTEQKMLMQDPAAVISEQCIKGNDALCVQALNLFCRIYGAEAGNLALKCLPYGGIVIAGGIATKILPVIQQGLLMQGFLAKGRYRNMLEKISVKVCTNSEAALFGAAHYTLQVE
jgi:glucokinase